MFEGICESIYREMDMLDEKLSSGKNQLNSQDLEHIDKMAHSLVSLKKLEMMSGGSEYESNARGRSRITGRYVSRDEGPAMDYGRRY